MRDLPLIIEPWDGANIVTCAQALADTPYCLFFDSNRPAHPLNQYSILLWNPLETMVNQDWHHIKKRMDQYNFTLPDNAPNLPFYGGLAGYVGYDKTNSHWGIYSCALIHDHHADQSWVIYGDKEQKDFLQRALSSITEHAPTNTQNIEWHSNINDQDYCTKIEQILNHINQGNVYQVNLTRQFFASRPDGFHPFTHYKKLRAINAAPFGAYMNLGTHHILSSSPERFISIRHGIIETRPIKGTLHASQAPDLLYNDPKERAENIMVVDLLRNDISKASKTGSVKVTKLCDIETFEGLHHMVSTIQSTLDTGSTPFDLLQKTLPGGSITGTPKIAAMQLIKQLEPQPRYIYCGCLGYIGFDTPHGYSMDTNIAIRTLVIDKKQISFGVGGGIVSDSIPDKELEETYLKAQKIFDSFKA